jgi:anti-anti-sigma factor
MIDESLSVALEQRDGVVILHVSGELDLLSAEEFDEALRAVTGNVVVDLAAVQFIDARGVDALAAAHERAASQGDRLSVINAGPIARRVLEICGLETMLDLGSDAP